MDTIAIGRLVARLTAGVAMGLCVLWSDGCNGLGKDSAERAVQTVQSKYDEVKADAKEYLPEQARLVEDAYASVKATLARGEYMKGLKQAEALTEKVGELRTVLAAKKTAFQNTWKDIDASVPSTMDELQKRIDTLEKSATLPDGITKDAIASAKAAIPVVRAKWAEALAAARSADWKVALDRADTVKKTAIELMTSLGMPVPGSWQSPTSDPTPAKP